MFRYLLGVVLLCGSAAAIAEEVDLALSDKSALFRYIQHSNSEYGQSQVDMGFLYTDKDDLLLMLGIQVEGEAGSGSPGLHVGVGVKGFSAKVKANAQTNTNSFDLFAVSLGGELRYIPMARLAIRGTLYYAPSIVTFMDADRFTYVTLSVEYEILPQATVYLGYRNVDIGIEGQGNAEFNDDTHLGLRIAF